MPAPADARLCPNCGHLAAEAVCPRDATATIALEALAHAHCELQAGQIIAGKYRIVGEIARGGHGVVYRAEHLFGLGTVALKLPRREGSNVDALRRFFREAQVTARLQGDGFARVIDVGQTETGALYLALEFIDGCTLEGRLKFLQARGEPMTEREATDIGLQVLDCLQIAHAAGLVHRDLKPSNLMVQASDGAVKLLDFGLAHTEDSSLTPSETALGTPDYMSPEQCQGDAVDARSDLYALGAILFRCLTGQPPFRAPSTMAVLYGHVNKPPADLASAALTPVSARFAQVVMRALAKRPQERFANAVDMREALLDGGQTPLLAVVPVQRGQASVEPGDPTASASGLPVQKPQRQRWPWAVAAVAAVVAVMAVAARDKPAAGAEPQPVPMAHPAAAVAVELPPPQALAAPAQPAVAAPAQPPSAHPPATVAAAPAEAARESQPANQAIAADKPRGAVAKMGRKPSPKPIPPPPAAEPPPAKPAAEPPAADWKTPLIPK